MGEQAQIAYVVTSGEYSDYVIHGVFTNKPKAVEARAYIVEHSRYGEYEVRIEEYPINPVPEQQLGAYGAIIYIEDGRHYCTPRWHPHVEPTKKAHVFGIDDNRVMGYGKTPEHATRSAEQKRREIKARPTDPQAGDDP